MKKKSTALFCSLALLLGASGCSRPTTEISPPKLNTCFTCTAKIECGELDSSAEITRLGSGAWEALFSEPSTLAGVKLSFFDDTVSASYKGLDFSVPKSAMPVESMLGSFIDVVDKLATSTETLKATNRDGLLEIEGDSEFGTYTMSFDANGELPVSFEMPSLPLKIKFDCFSHDVTSPESETTTEAVTSTSETQETTTAE